MPVFWCLVFFMAVWHFGESKVCEEALDGILGELLVLYRLPSTPEYKKIGLKYIKESLRKKLLEYDLQNQKFQNTSHSKYRFNKSDRSVGIDNLQRDDEKDYELTLEKEDGVEAFCNIKVKVYEQISDLMVKVTEDSLNDTCTVTMKCLMGTGDNVTYSWMKDEKNLSHEGSTLEISITSDNANSTYTCTAKNPVSEQSSNHTLSSACKMDKDNSHHGFIPYIPVAICVVVLTIIVVTAVIAKLCKKGMYKKRYINHPNGKQSRPLAPEPQGRPPAPQPVPEPMHEATQTVYAKVNKSEPPVLPFSSVYELAGPSRDNPPIQNRVHEETRRCEASANSSSGQPYSLKEPTFSMHC